jgi:putative aldouronate transport system permease protein
VYTAGSGKTLRTVTVSVPETATGKTAYRTVLYVAVTLLALLVFVLLYFFLYERDLGFPVFNTFLLILLMFITLYPVLNTVAYSFNDGTDAARGGIGLLPRKFSTKSYERILNDPDIWQAALISVSKTIITTVLNLFWTGMLSFALSRREYVLRKFITLTMVLTMYVNAGLIPSYLLISQTLHLRNTFWVYIIPTMFSCFNMIIIRTYIMGLPDALVESARIDGAGDFRIYWQIIFPLCAPVLATVALFIAVGSWNSWFDTMLYNATNKHLHTLQYVLMGKVANAGQTASLAQNSSSAAADLAKTTVNTRTVQCATTVVTALPILVVYPFLQKYFVTGMALGSVKG